MGRKTFSKGQAWIDLLLLANSSDRKVPFGKKLILVKRGEKMTSIRKLEQRWGWSNNKVKSFLNMLQDDGMITYKCTTKNTFYNIVNYNDYQDKNNSKSITKAYQKHIKSIQTIRLIRLIILIRLIRYTRKSLSTPGMKILILRLMKTNLIKIGRAHV